MTKRYTEKLVLCAVALFLVTGFEHGLAAAGAVESDAVSIRHGYVKKATWAETMLACRKGLAEALAEYNSMMATLDFGPWYITAPLEAENFSDALFPERSVNIKALGEDGEKIWQKRSEWRDGKVHSLPSQSPASTYLYRTITCTKANSVIAGFGSNDGLEVWLNSDKLLSKRRWQEGCAGSGPGEAES
jgi:hypothetical protein